MKSPALLIIIVLSHLSPNAQGVFDNQTSTALQKVIEDYPNKFKDIRGNKLPGDLMLACYESKVVIPGASNIVITREGSSGNESYAWKCSLFESGDFERARDKFREYYSHIKNSIIKIDGQKPFILNGNFENPLENQKFTRVLFQLLPAAGDMQNLKVELALQQVSREWVITLKVYDRAEEGFAQNAGTNR